MPRFIGSQSEGIHRKCYGQFTTLDATAYQEMDYLFDQDVYDRYYPNQFPVYPNAVIGINTCSAKKDKRRVMAQATQLLRDDAYEEMGYAYQCVQIATLDAALKESGIDDAAVRQQVCESFVFNMGNFHDQGWFKSSADAKPVYPLLCFAETFLNTDSPVDQIGTVYAQAEMFAYHECAFGNVDLFYSGDPNATVETGSFMGEDKE